MREVMIPEISYMDFCIGCEQVVLEENNWGDCHKCNIFTLLCPYCSYKNIAYCHSCSEELKDIIPDGLDDNVKHLKVLFSDIIDDYSYHIVIKK